MKFSNQVVVVTGAAAGIGAAVTESLLLTDAVVHAVDIAAISSAVAQAHHCDLGDEAAIDGLVGELPDQVDMLINCAGVPNGGRFTAAEVMAINWLGLRHFTESLLPRIVAGGSITHVASTAGRAWADNLESHQQLMTLESFAAGAAWIETHSEVIGDGYAFSKQAVQYYTMWRARQTLHAHDVRMNSICPGVTNTQLAADFRRGVGDDVIDRAISIAGRAAEAHEMAPALLFLADHRQASYINGINLNVDRGTGAAHLVGEF